VQEEETALRRRAGRKCSPKSRKGESAAKERMLRGGRAPAERGEKKDLSLESKRGTAKMPLRQDYTSAAADGPSRGKASWG